MAAAAPFSLFYYPYAAFGDAQLPLLQAAAVYFDKLYILDPERASGMGVGVSAPVAAAVAELEAEQILVRVAPEDVLDAHSHALTMAIHADCQDEEFVRLCEEPGNPDVWRLALAKIPAELQRDGRLRSLDERMDSLLGELPLAVPEPLRPRVIDSEVWGIGGEEMVSYTYERHLSDDAAPGVHGEVAYRYATLSFPVGEAIMVNHALLAAQQTDATPVTDNPLHRAVLERKLRRVGQDRAVRHVIAERTAKHHLLAATALQDRELKLPFLSPQFDVRHLLEYRNDHADELVQTRERLGGLARQIRQQPWTAEFEAELEHRVIPELIAELDQLRRARDSWLRGARGRLALDACGLSFSTAGTIAGLLLAPTPLLPIALGLAGASAIPAIKTALDWRAGSADASANGLHYLLNVPPR